MSFIAPPSYRKRGPRERRQRVRLNLLPTTDPNKKGKRWIPKDAHRAAKWAMPEKADDAARRQPGKSSGQISDIIPTSLENIVYFYDLGHIAASAGSKKEHPAKAEYHVHRLPSRREC